MAPKNTTGCLLPAVCFRLLRSTEDYQRPADRCLLIAAGNPPFQWDWRHGRDELMTLWCCAGKTVVHGKFQEARRLGEGACAVAPISHSRPRHQGRDLRFPQEPDRTSGAVDSDEHR